MHDQESENSANSSRINHPDQLDALVVVNSSLWIALSGLMLLTLSGIIWAFVGSLPIQVKGKGIFMSRDGGFTAQAMMEGIVKNIAVKPGDLVQKGDLLLEIISPKEEIKLKAAELKVANTNKNLENFKKIVQEEGAAVKSGIESDLEAKNYTIQQKELNLAVMDEDVVKKRQLYTEGLISALTLRETESKIIEAKIEIQSLKASVVALQASLLKAYRTDEIKQKEQELFSQIEERDLIKANLAYSKVHATARGRILELLVSNGDLVNEGDSLVWLEHPVSVENPMMIYAYFPIEKSKLLFKGQQIETSNHLQGNISEISRYAISSESILRLFHSQALGEYLTAGKSAVVSVLVDPHLEPVATPAHGEEVHQTSEVSTGTVVDIRVLLGRVKPIYYLLPLDRFKEK